MGSLKAKGLDKGHQRVLDSINMKHNLKNKSSGMSAIAISKSPLKLSMMSKDNWLPSSPLLQTLPNSSV